MMEEMYNTGTDVCNPRVKWLIRHPLNLQNPWRNRIW